MPKKSAVRQVGLKTLTMTQVQFLQAARQSGASHQDRPGLKKLAKNFGQTFPGARIGWETIRDYLRQEERREIQCKGVAKPELYPAHPNFRRPHLRRAGMEEPLGHRPCY